MSMPTACTPFIHFFLSDKLDEAEGRLLVLAFVAAQHVTVSTTFEKGTLPAADEPDP